MKKTFTLLLLLCFAQGLSAQNALNFPDADDYGKVPADPVFELTGDFTIEAWVKVSGSSYQTVVSTDSLVSFSHYGYWFGVTPSGTAGIQLFNGTTGWTTTSGTTNINDDNWHHIAATANGTNVYIIVDGVEEGTGNYYAPAFNGHALDVGVDQEGNDLTGTIDDLRIWWRAIPAAEINLYKDSCLNGTEDSLVALYRFDETAGSTFADDGPYGLNGNLANMTDSDWVAGVLCTPTVSINDLFTEGFAVYPNPTEGDVNINLGELNSVSIEVYSLDGQLVYSAEKLTTNEHEFKLEGHAGIYHVIISTDSKREHLKLVKL